MRDSSCRWVIKSHPRPHLARGAPGNALSTSLASAVSRGWQYATAYDMYYETARQRRERLVRAREVEAEPTPQRDAIQPGGARRGSSACTHGSPRRQERRRLRRLAPAPRARPPRRRRRRRGARGTRSFAPPAAAHRVRAAPIRGGQVPSRTRPGCPSRMSAQINLDKIADSS